MSDSQELDLEKEYARQIEDEGKKQLESHQGLIDAFKISCRKKDIILTNNNFEYVQTIGIVAKYPDLVLLLKNELSRDKENLVDCKVLHSSLLKKEFMPGYFYDENFMVMANPCFRRGLYGNANYAPRFIELFWGIDDENMDSYLSLDYDRVRINVDNSQYAEYDTWYGAPFNREIRHIQDGNLKLKPPLDLDAKYISLFFKDAYSMDVKWKTKGNIKTFQSEELKTDSITVEKNGNQFHPVRYIHAEFDIIENSFRHFDGAVHYYTKKEYAERKDFDLDFNRKKSTQVKSLSEKLFKFNGHISVSMWVEFCSHFFAGNPLVYEYFSGKYPDNLNGILEIVRALPR